MKRIVCKKEYDTEKSRLLEKRTVGEYGDDRGYEESLYETADGSFFLYLNGGEKSKHPTESIKRMSKKSAEFWLSEK